MNGFRIAIFFFVVILIFSLSAYVLKNNFLLLTSSPTENTPVHVQKVIDGDTIDVIIDGKNERVRFIGIDAPEFGYDGNPDMCFAKEGYQKLKELVDGKTVRLEVDSTQDDRDKYGRLLRYVFLEDGTHVNEMMINGGFVREYTYLGNFYLYQRDFQEAEKKAQTGKSGFWADGVCE